jgi:hypothetical protein
MHKTVSDNLEERRNLGYIDEDGRIILKKSSKKKA